MEKLGSLQKVLAGCSFFMYNIFVIGSFKKYTFQNCFYYVSEPTYIPEVYGKK